MTVSTDFASNATPHAPSAPDLPKIIALNAQKIIISSMAIARVALIVMMKSALDAIAKNAHYVLLDSSLKAITALNAKQDVKVALIQLVSRVRTVFIHYTKKKTKPLSKAASHALLIIANHAQGLAQINIPATNASLVIISRKTNALNALNHARLAQAPLFAPNALTAMF